MLYDFRGKRNGCPCPRLVHRTEAQEAGVRPGGRGGIESGGGSRDGPDRGESGHLAGQEAGEVAAGRRELLEGPILDDLALLQLSLTISCDRLSRALVASSK